MGYPGQTARCATRSELDPAYDSPVTNSQTRCHPTHIPVETAMLRVDFGVAPGFEFLSGVICQCKVRIQTGSHGKHPGSGEDSRNGAFTTRSLLACRIS